MRRRFLKSDVKSCGSTTELHQILGYWSAEEVDGITSVAVECVDISKKTGGEGGQLGRN